jgi:hypothetical protein
MVASAALLVAATAFILAHPAAQPITAVKAALIAALAVAFLGRMFSALFLHRE